MELAATRDFKVLTSEVDLEADVDLELAQEALADLT